MNFQVNLLALLVTVVVMTTVNGQAKNYKGCWTEDVTDREFAFEVQNRGGKTDVLSCMTGCRLQQYRYAGVQDKECWCGSTYRKHGSGEPHCKRCKYNYKINCGDKKHSVYSVYDTSPYATPGTPSITVQETSKSYNVRCNIISPMPNAVYKVWWKVDGKPLVEEELRTGKTFAELRPTQLFLNGASIADKYLSCTVAGRYLADNKPDSWGTKVFSKPFYVGIEITDEVGKIVKLNKGLNLGEGRGNTTLYFRPTLPVNELTLGLTANNFAGSKDLVCRHTNRKMDQVVLSTCSLQFNSSNWNQPQSVVFKAVEDFKLDGVQKVHIQLDVIQQPKKNKRAATNTVAATLTDPMDVPSFAGLEIITQEFNQGKAVSQSSKSTNDPHMVTFDGLAYDNQNLGEFILYRHKELPFEVRTAYSQCAPPWKKSVTCNCGVAVRVGDDVMVVDNCRGSKSTKVKVYTGNDDKLADGFTLASQNGGRRYVITLPSRAQVVVTRSVRHFINVRMTPSTVDLGKTEGLSGTFNGNKDDDLVGRDGKKYKYTFRPDDFSLSWRVSKAVTLFNGHVPPSAVTYNPPALDEDDGKLCSCRKNEPAVCDRSNVQRCEAPKADIARTMKEKPNPTKNDAPVDFDPTYRPKEPAWPTPSGITKQQARADCDKYFKDSKAYQHCRNVIPVDESLSNCVEDIKLTDTMDFALSALETYKQDCLQKIDQQHGTPPDDAFCLNECSFKGVCQNHTCRCATGYVGEDCSISAVDSPKASAEPTCCNVAYGDKCNVVTMTSNGFSSSIDYVCHRLNTDDFADQHIAAKAAVKYKTYEKLECTFPYPTANSRYEVAVSIGATLKRDPDFFAVYDSRCMTCNDSNGNIKIHPDMCYINGACFNANDTNPAWGNLTDSVNETCIPSKSQLSWSQPDLPDNPCLKAGCGDICYLDAKNNPVCSCRMGFQLAANKKDCQEIPKLLNQCDKNKCRIPCTPIAPGVCTCPTGYQLNANTRYCEDINECDYFNGGCEQTCTNFGGGHECSCTVSCAKGFIRKGDRCIRANRCLQNNGGCKRYCLDHDPTQNVLCSCDKGYELMADGKTCKDIDECAKNNGGCREVCKNLLGSYECHCREDDICFAGYIHDKRTKKCLDIDECVSGIHRCKYDQKCVNTEGSYWCENR